MSRESLVVSLQSLAIIPINLPYILSMTHKIRPLVEWPID